MIDARVSGMVWLKKCDVHPSTQKFFREKLLIVPRKFGNYGDDVKVTPIKCWAETPDEIGIPRAFWFNSAKGKYRYEWDVSFGRSISIESKLKQEGVYAEQGVVLDKLAKYYEPVEAAYLFETEYQDLEIGRSLGGIFQADPGFGKTNTALAFIRQIGFTTVIFVHKEFLLKQWVRRAQKWLPGVKVGICQGPVCDYEGKDIVVAMIESLALEDGTRYPKEFYDWPGLIVLDEIHRVGAPSWSPVPQLFSSAFRLGLTATPRRKDGADDVFWWHFGRVVCKAETEMPKPSVRMIQVSKPFNHPPILSRQDSNDSIVVTILSKMTARNWRITQETIKALRAPSKRKIMVLSERLEHLRQLEKELQVEVRKDPKLLGSGITTGFYVGEWFSGIKQPKLAPKTWKMDGDGREKAIKAIYSSISRRKNYEGSIEKRDGKKVHHVYINDEDARCALCIADVISEKVLVVLEDQTDDDLYALAAYFQIAQKTKEKMRPTTDEEQVEAEKCRVIYATYQMCSEGVDIPALDVVLLATPVSDVEQTAGRARRFCFPDPNDPDKCTHFCAWRAGECQGKPVPVIADIVDLGYPLCAKRERWRKQWYWNNEFKVSVGG